MVRDKFSAIWVSYSSIGDYLKCPRAYYLNNVYRDPDSNHKVTLMSPPLALGQAVHGVIEEVSKLPVAARLQDPLAQIFERIWRNVAGNRGGFSTRAEEEKYKARGLAMLENVEKHPGPLMRKAVKLRQELPHFWLSEDEGIILCGKIDWLEYVPEIDGIKVIDFKTGKFDEDAESLQLPIYYLIVKNCQNRKIAAVSYWYLERDEAPTEMALPDADNIGKVVLEVAKKIALARKLEHFVCKNHEGCSACLPLEKIVRGEGEFVGINDFNQDIYVLK